MQGVTEGTAELNGASIYYQLAGAGPPLVLVHGFSLDTRMWDEQFEVFAELFTVLRFDVRGFGRSSVPDGRPYTTEGDLRALLGYLAIEKPVLIGQSMGGGIALDYAVAYPDGLRALVVVDAVLGGFQWLDETAESFEAVYDEARASGVEAARATWLAHPIFAPGLANPRSSQPIRRIVGDYSGWHWANPGDDTNVQLHPPAIGRLHAIDVPVLAVVGELDVPDFHSITSILETNITGAQSHVLPGAGHMSNMEAPQEFNGAVLEFLHLL
jgi:pimeloyl-ACP methyl ester carboxylesterase